MAHSRNAAHCRGNGRAKVKRQARFSLVESIMRSQKPSTLALVISGKERRAWYGPISWGSDRGHLISSVLKILGNGVCVAL